MHPESTPEIPLGLCQCGCGNPTKIATRNSRNDGHVKGVPLRYLRGHGRPRTYSDSDVVTDLVTGCMVRPGFQVKEYVQRRVGGKLKSAHIIAWERVNGPVPEGFELDHKCNNRPCENVDHLRLATDPQQQQNQRKRRGCRSRFKGVSLAKHGKRWRARLSKQQIGLFDSEEEAARAYDDAARLAYGEFARVNFPRKGERQA